MYMDKEKEKLFLERIDEKQHEEFFSKERKKERYTHTHAWLSFGFFQ